MLGFALVFFTCFSITTRFVLGSLFVRMIWEFTVLRYGATAGKQSLFHSPKLLKYSLWVAFFLLAVSEYLLKFGVLPCKSTPILGTTFVTKQDFSFLSLFPNYSTKSLFRVFFVLIGYSGVNS